MVGEVGESRSRAAKLCNFCKEVPASVFCRADSAFLCAPCDDRVHSANKLASRHARVWICEVCEQAPAAFTCKADAAALCASCDRDIHSANSLASRHERIPVIPFYDAASASKSTGPPAAGEFSEEEVEAASWLLPDPDCKAAVEDLNSPGYTSAEYLFNEMDNHYLDLDLIAGDQKPGHHADGVDEKQVYSSDGVVPVQHKSELNSSVQYPGPAVNGYPSYDVEYPSPKPLVYSFSSQAISHSVSSSSIDVGVVPDQGDVSTTHWKNDVGSDGAPTPVSGVDREARVLRYREKRKNRRFEKTIRYASRKAYAETRPRIKGRFAKRTELDVDWLVHQDPSYGVVPSS